MTSYLGNSRQLVPILPIEGKVLGYGTSPSPIDSSLMGCLGILTLSEKTHMTGIEKEGVVRPEDSNLPYTP